MRLLGYQFNFYKRSLCSHTCPFSKCSITSIKDRPTNTILQNQERERETWFFSSDCTDNRPLPYSFSPQHSFLSPHFIYLAILPSLRTSWAILPRCEPLIPLLRRSPPLLPPDDRRGRRQRQRQCQTAEQGEHVVWAHSLKPGGQGEDEGHGKEVADEGDGNKGIADNLFVFVPGQLLTSLCILLWLWCSGKKWG